MSEFNRLERILARTLARFPVVKRMTKSAYGRIAYLIYAKKYDFKCSGKLRFYGRENGESFFGYYDKSPESLDGHVLAYMYDASTAEKPGPESPIVLALFSPDAEKPSFALPISSYNWQQGARAQWVSSDLIAVNDYDEARKIYISKLISKSDFVIRKTYDYPIQDAFSTNYFLSVNYRRLAALRPDYGYTNMPPLNSEELRDVSNDGIWRVEFETGDAKLIVSLESVCELSPPPSHMDGAYHKVNHVMISPLGDKFIFLHRLVLNGRRFDRLLLADSVTGELRLLNDSGMVSHYTWIDNERLLGYMRGPDAHDGYWVVDVQAGSFEHFANGSLDHYGDGHPHAQGDLVITDTYPDRARMQKLILTNWRTGKVQEIGEFFHGFDYGAECRCDLHPRLSPDGKRAYFDSVFDGKRRLYSVDLAK